MSHEASCTGLSPCIAGLSRPFQSLFWARLVRVRSPLLAESLLISFPPGTKMFQFPGFALKPLCIQGKSTWLCLLMIPRIACLSSHQGWPAKRALRSNNNKQSGGFPHSDISGSKPIPGSPKLNAGYHVLHRLLLPRHPPNALFALDLIQEEQDHWFKVLALPKSIACTFPPLVTPKDASWLVY